MYKYRMFAYGLLLLLLIGCAGRSPLVAKWKRTNGNTIEFFKDGTFSLYEKNTIMSSSTAGTWKEVDSNAISISGNAGIFGTQSAVVHWSVEGDILHWKEDSGFSTTYTRIAE